MGWTRQEVLDVARSTGRPVVEAWSAHNAGQMGTVLGPMLHHTGSGWSYPTNTAPTLRTVREGRSDLQNALCMYYIDYEGVIYCITEKIAWHAGAGSWQGVTDGNGHFAGIEAESDGQQWTKATTASYKRLAAAILRKTGRTVAYAPRHADYALPKGRKTDFSGMDPAGFLADVNADLAGNPPPEENVMDARQETAVIARLDIATSLASDIRNALNDPRMGALAQLARISAVVGTQRADIDEAELAKNVIVGLVPVVVEAVGKVGGLTVEQVTAATEKAVRAVFADASTAAA